MLWILLAERSGACIFGRNHVVSSDSGGCAPLLNHPPPTSEKNHGQPQRSTKTERHSRPTTDTTETRTAPTDDARTDHARAGLTSASDLTRLVTTDDAPALPTESRLTPRDLAKVTRLRPLSLHTLRRLTMLLSCRLTMLAKSQLTMQRLTRLRHLSLHAPRRLTMLTLLGLSLQELA